MTPRTRLSADLLSTELLNAISSTNKNISVASIWQPNSEKENDENPINLPNFGPNIKNIYPIHNKILAERYPDIDADAYLKTGGGQKIPDEDGLISEMIRQDINSENSDIKKRV